MRIQLLNQITKVFVRAFFILWKPMNRGNAEACTETPDVVFASKANHSLYSQVVWLSEQLLDCGYKRVASLLCPGYCRDVDQQRVYDGRQL
mmetsp:Transcript_34498/g.83491  ORF Transcript_34498/g.83491 Transcript_34498/m.83491 type:complete len:91 (+) Transcript_34498:456-728(+)